MARAPKLKIAQGKHTGTTPSRWKVDCIPITQGPYSLYLFKAKASTLFRHLSINRRMENKDQGYQRTLSISRVEAIARHIKAKRPLPGCLVVAFDKAPYSESERTLSVPRGTDTGWVIDGQHRLAGAYEASKDGTDIELAVVAFVGLNNDKQVEQFITINREAKGVPTSLYLDLLGKLSTKKSGDVAKERASDLAGQLRRDENSVFFERIVVTTAPKTGQVSMVNFARKIASLVHEKGILAAYTEKEQVGVINNYYAALRVVFPEEFNRKESIFFKTVGFGGLWNAFQTFFSYCLSQQSGFEVKDAVAVFQKIADFDFDSWKELGTGSQAENTAGEDLKTALQFAFDTKKKGGTGLRV